jgi:hypothetical protein
MKTYFDTAVREGRYYSEDWTFCENWRDIGGQVWIDKRVLLRHTGTYVFDGNTQEQTYRDLKAIFEPNMIPADAPQIAPPATEPPASTETEAKVIASSTKKPKKVANGK